MLRRTLTQLLVLALLASAPSLAAAAPRSGGARGEAHTSATLPPDLVTLEQKTLALQVTSERFSFAESVTGSGAPEGPFGAFARASASQTFLTLTGEVGFEPLQARFEGELFGALKVAGRVIGSTAYLEEPELAKTDGGRPWLEEPNEPVDRATGVALTGLAGGGSTGAEKAFGAIVTELGHARSVVEVGARNVDGQPVTVFRAIVDADTFGDETTAQRHALLKLFKPLLRVEVMFAESGEPVRDVVSLSTRRGHVQLVGQEDVLALNQPVAPVEAPPASQTITEAQLQVLEARELQHLAEVVRKHRHRRKHG